MRARLWLCLLLVSCSFLSAARAQHAVTRQQWQPQTDKDPRLDQTVRLELLGRAVVSGLPLLSEKTGVKLEVAPENRDALGERKFTLLAQNCTLRAIMVQLCEALQECHWDLDVDGPQPVYLLHQELGVETAALKRKADEEAGRVAERRAAREERMEAGRAALKMTPEQLAELEKTDPILARAVQDPVMRAEMEAFLSLPAEAVQSWQQDGTISDGMVFRYEQAPVLVRKATEAVVEAHLKWMQRRPEMTPEWWRLPSGEVDPKAAPVEDLRQWQEHASRVTVTFFDQDCDFGFGVRMLVRVPMEKGLFTFSDAALPPRYISTDEGSWAYDRMLQATGSPDHDAAWEIIRQTERAGSKIMAQREEANRKAARVVPTDPALLQEVKLESDQLGLPAIQQSLAKQTGLSIVSDYYLGRRVYVAKELLDRLPLWQFLYTLGEGREGKPAYLWQKRGSFLVFYEEDWPTLTAQEVPESLVLAYQEKLTQQGHLTLDDFAAFSVALGERSSARAPLPDDLAATGLESAARAQRSLRMFASLSPAQLALARGEAGLAYEEMTIFQRHLLSEIARRLSPPVLGEEIQKASFRMVEKTQQQKRGGKTWESTLVSFRVPFGDRTFDEGVRLRQVIPDPPKTASP